MLLLTLLLFLMGGKKADTQGKAVPAVNRGLMQAETIRTHKDQLDEKDRKRNEEPEWVKKFEEMRSHPSILDEAAAMPDPVPQFPGTGKRMDALVDVKPSHGEDAGAMPWKMPSTHKPIPSSDSHAPDPVPSGIPSGFRQDDRIAMHMSDEYQKALAFNSSEQLVFTRDRRERDGNTGKPPLPEKGSKPGQASGKVIVSAGQELTAILNEALDSDYPSVAKATLTSPAELAGATLLLSYTLGQERVSAQVLKLILPAKEGEQAHEQNLAAVVKSGLPGLGGDVSHHWIPQITAGVANAGLTAGALYYASQNQNKDLGTAVLVAPMIEQSVQGVMKPINYLGRDRPITVKVPAGTEFKLLVTEGFEVEP
jgi:hypothetical protein